jgi:hypothetical protein
VNDENWSVTSDRPRRLRICARAGPRPGQQLVEPALRVILHSRDDVSEDDSELYCSSCAGVCTPQRWDFEPPESVRARSLKSTVSLLALTLKHGRVMCHTPPLRAGTSSAVLRILFLTLCVVPACTGERDPAISASGVVQQSIAPSGRQSPENADEVAFCAGAGACAPGGSQWNCCTENVHYYGGCYRCCRNWGYSCRSNAQCCSGLYCRNFGYTVYCDVR